MSKTKARAAELAAEALETAAKEGRGWFTTLCLLVARVVWFFVSRPSLTIPVVGVAWLAGQWATAHPGVQFCTGLAAPAAMYSWRRWHRPSYAVAVKQVRQWWARWVRYGLLWGWWMSRAGLNVKTDAGAVIRPSVLKVRTTPSVDRLLLRLPVGLPPSDVVAKLEVLQHATGATQARVRSHRARRIWLELERRNPLAKAFGAIAIPEGRDALDPKRLDGLVIGYADDGTPWRLKVRGTHVFIAGATGSGKGSVIWSVLRALAPFINAGIVQVWAIDPKGGMELEFGAAMFTRYERDDYPAMARLLADAVAYMDATTKRLRGKVRKFTPSTDTPLVVVLVDEQASLTALCPDSRLATKVEESMGLLLTKGRAPGVCLIGAVQDVTKAVTVWRDLYPTKVALRLEKPDHVDMVLGDGTYDAGAWCDKIPEGEKWAGIGYVKVEGKAEPVRVRAAFVTDAEIKAMAAEYPAPVNVTEDEPAAGASTRTAVAELVMATTAPTAGDVDVVPGEVTASSVHFGKDSRPSRGPDTSRPPRKPRKPRKPRAPRAPRGSRAGSEAPANPLTEVETEGSKS